jgi:hypothetical protein
MTFKCKTCGSELEHSYTVNTVGAAKFICEVKPCEKCLEAESDASYWDGYADGCERAEEI